MLRIQKIILKSSREKIDLDPKINQTDPKKIIPRFANRCLRVLVCIKKFPHDQLWPEIAKFIANLHRINILDAVERSDLALDALDDSDTLDSS